MADADGFFTAMAPVVTSELDKFINKISPLLINDLQPALIAGLTLYFMCKAWSIMYRNGQGTMQQLTMQCIKIAFISVLFCNTLYFYEYIKDPLYGLDSAMTKTLNMGDNPFESIDHMFASISAKSDRISVQLNEASSKLGWYDKINCFMTIMTVKAGACFLKFCACITAFIAFVILLTNSVGLAFAIAFAPLFGSLLMFPVTKPLFESWLKVSLNFAFAKVLIVCAIIMVTNIIMNVLGFTAGELPDGSQSTFGVMQDSLTPTITVDTLKGPGSNIIAGSSLIILTGIMVLCFGFLIVKCPAISTALIGGVSMGGGIAENVATQAPTRALSAVTGAPTQMKMGYNKLKNLLGTHSKSSSSSSESVPAGK